MGINTLKKRLKKLKRQTRQGLAYYKKQWAIRNFGTFDEGELYAHCRGIGIRPNDILLVHCSMDDLLTYGGSLAGLLLLLQNLVAPKGTLLMPALSTNLFSSPPRLFDVLKEPTYTGIIPELFRRTAGVIRSLHPRHSICALGPLAHELTEGHENCVYADGAGSPWDRLRLAGAKGLSLGLRPGEAATFFHWVENIEPEKYPLPIHEGPVECVLKDREGKELTRKFYKCNNMYKFRAIWFGKQFSGQAVSLSKIRGVPISLYNYKTLSEELIALRDRGITGYRQRFLRA